MERTQPQGRHTLKIDKLGLGPRIVEMINEDHLNKQQVLATLQAEGSKISMGALETWMNRNGFGDTRKAKKLFSDHIDKTMPTDLEAMEGLEKQCLVWAHETKKKFAEKTAIAKAKAWTQSERFKVCRKDLFNTTPGTKKELRLAKEVLAAAMEMVTDEYAHRKFRLMAGKEAARIIQTKLTFSGILDGAGSGNIIIKPYGNDLQVKPEGKSLNPKPKPAKLVSFRGGNGQS